MIKIQTSGRRLGSVFSESAGPLDKLLFATLVLGSGNSSSSWGIAGELAELIAGSSILDHSSPSLGVAEELAELVPGSPPYAPALCAMRVPSQATFGLCSYPTISCLVAQCEVA